MGEKIKYNVIIVLNQAVTPQHVEYIQGYEDSLKAL
jgi:hypothetical protein